MKKAPLKHSFLRAFTMIELVFVIVVAGILAAVIIPSTRTNPLQEAAIQVLSDIRYTQHLAIVDDKYDGTNNWFISRWNIFFKLDNSANGNIVYEVHSDMNKLGGQAGTTEIAVNPLSSLRMTGDTLYGSNRTTKMDLTDNYGIVSAPASIMTGGCANSQRIYFDHLGRPHTNNNTAYGTLLYTACDIKLTHSDGTDITIQIQPETGYSCILNAEEKCRDLQD